MSLNNGEVSYNKSPVNNGRYPFNTQASFTCNSGYRLEGSSSSTCQGQGSWNNDIPTCTRGNDKMKLPILLNIVLQNFVTRWFLCNKIMIVFISQTKCEWKYFTSRLCENIAMLLHWLLS